MENFVKGEEKRRYRRMDSNIPVQYKNLRVSTEFPTGTITRNLSEGGVCFKSNKFVSLACRLIVEISLPTSLKPIKAISKVAWIRKIPATNQYELGSQFLEITKGDRANIFNFVNQSLGSSVTTPASIVISPAPITISPTTPEAV